MRSRFVAEVDAVTYQIKTRSGGGVQLRAKVKAQGVISNKTGTLVVTGG